MADHFIGLNNDGLRDDGDANFTLGTSTGATDVEVRIADAASWTRGTLARKLQAITDYVAGKAEFPIL